MSGSGHHRGTLIRAKSECVMVPNLFECESSFYGQESLCGHSLEVVHLESWLENITQGLTIVTAAGGSKHTVSAGWPRLSKCCVCVC